MTVLRSAVISVFFAVALAASSDAPTSVPASYGFDCAVLGKLPYGGTEILYASALFLGLTLLWGVTYADIVFKQWFPTQFVDPSVQAVMAQVKAALPNLNLSAEEKKKLYSPESKTSSHYAMASDGTPVKYDAVASQESYIASKTIDLDMMYQVLNNNTFSTMSEYSADTVRGYNMLSCMLSSAAFGLTFLALHNFYVDPRAIAPGFLNIQWGVLAVFFYPGILCTAFVMTGPSSIVNRNSNICLMSNLPSKLAGNKNPLRGLHVLGVVLFAFPAIQHLGALLSWGPATTPNYATDMTLLLLALAGAAVFGVGNIWHKFSNNAVMGNNVSITGEWFMMICCFLSCAHWEAYPTMYCSGNVTSFQIMLYGAFLAPFALVARNQIWAPTAYATTPSLLLMYQGQPTATWGPCPVEAYHGEEVPNTSTVDRPWQLRRINAAPNPIPHVV
jgi:hypothetical protein